MKSNGAKSSQTKSTKENLKTAATMRQELKGRYHSDSTELVIGDRIRASDESIAERDYTLEDLLGGIIGRPSGRHKKKNRHAEIDFGQTQKRGKRARNRSDDGC